MPTYKEGDKKGIYIIVSWVETKLIMFTLLNLEEKR